MRTYRIEFVKPEEMTATQGRERSKSVGDKPSGTIRPFEKIEGRNFAEDRDELECAICADTYKDPKLLQCMHTFCEGCIERLWSSDDEQGAVVCPICRFVTKVNLDGTLGLCRNHIIQQKVRWREVATKRDNNELLCSDCEVEAPTKLCINCCWKLCEICTAHHKRSARFRGHSIQGIEAVANDELIEKEPVRCSQHGEQMKHYCETCSTMICVDCAQSEPHQGHIFQPLQDVMNKEMIDLQESIDEFDEVCEGYNEHLSRFDAFQNKATEERDRSKKRVEDAFAELESILIEEKQKLLNWLDEKYELSDQALKRAKERVHHVKAMCQYFDEVTRYSFEEMFDVIQDGVPRWKETVGNMKTLNEKKPAVLPSTFELVFSPVHAIQKGQKTQENKNNEFDVAVHARQIEVSDSFEAFKMSLRQLGKLPVDETISDGPFAFKESLFQGPSGDIHLEVKNVSTLDKTMEPCLSPELHHGNVSWACYFTCKEADDASKSKKTEAAIYISCNPIDDSSPDHCNALCIVTLKHENGVDLSRIMIRDFTVPVCWGWLSFIPWENLVDEKSGYLQNDTVSIHVQIQILPYVDTSK